MTAKTTPPAKTCLAAYALPSGAGSLNYTFTPSGYFPCKRAAKAALADIMAQHPEAVHLILETRRKTPSGIFNLLAAEAQKRGMTPENANHAEEEQP